MYIQDNDKAKMIVRIDGMKDGSHFGYIYNCFSDEIYFSDLADMVLKIDELCDEYDYPQSSNEDRSYKKDTRGKIPETAEERIQLEKTIKTPVIKHEFSDLAERVYNAHERSYIIMIDFRTDATWKGTLWYQKNKRRKQHSFSSVLELMKYIKRSFPKDFK